MDFIKDLQEAKLTRNNNYIGNLSYIDCCDRVYLSLLIIELLRHFTSFKTSIINYCKKTSNYSEYNNFKHDGTDLHNFLYFLNGNDTALKKLKNYEAAKTAKSLRRFPKNFIKKYLKQVSLNNNPQQVFEMFNQIEVGLKINNSELKLIRRSILTLERLSSSQLKIVVTKLLNISRVKLKSSDLIDKLEKFSSKNDLELSKTLNTTQIQKSIDDPSTSGSDIYVISKLVGQSNVFMAIKFLEYVNSGNNIPSGAVSAFKPAIDILVDIIYGGPTYLEKLKSLQHQANSSKRNK